MDAICDPSLHVQKDAFDKDALNVEFKNLSPYHVAALRRTMMTTIPTWAVDKAQLDLYTGTEPWDHVLHRLHIITIKASQLPAQFQSSNEAMYVHFSFKNEYDHPMFISVKSIIDQQFERLDASPHVDIVDDEISICQLGRNQSLSGKLHITLNEGIEHDKWAPGVALSILPKIKITMDKSIINNPSVSFSNRRRMAMGLASTCSEGVFRVSDDDIEDLITVDESKCTLCKRCEMEWNRAINLKVNIDEEYNTLHIETNGSMTAGDLLIRSFDELSNKCRSLLDAINSE